MSVKLAPVIIATLICRHIITMNYIGGYALQVELLYRNILTGVDLLRVLYRFPFIHYYTSYTHQYIIITVFMGCLIFYNSNHCLGKNILSIETGSVFSIRKGNIVFFTCLYNRATIFLKPCLDTFLILLEHNNVDALSNGRSWDIYTDIIETGCALSKITLFAITDRKRTVVKYISVCAIITVPHDRLA